MSDITRTVLYTISVLATGLCVGLATHPTTPPAGVSTFFTAGMLILAIACAVCALRILCAEPSTDPKPETRNKADE